MKTQAELCTKINSLSKTIEDSKERIKKLNFFLNAKTIQGSNLHIDISTDINNTTHKMQIPLPKTRDYIDFMLNAEKVFMLEQINNTETILKKHCELLKQLFNENSK